MRLGGAAVAYAVGFVALAVWGAMLWRLYCEGFGCIGKGIAWFAWSIGYAVLLIVGLIAWRACGGRAGRALRYGLAVQAAAGVFLVAYWLAWRAG